MARKPYRCALYLRVSTDRQIDPEGSIKSQLQRLREELEYRSRRDDESPWVEAAVFTDEGKSGSTTEGRYEYLRMMQGVADGKFDVVMAIELSRISRSIPDFCDFLSTIRERNCQFVAVNQPIDTTSIHGDLIAKLMVCLAEFERKMTGARTKDSMAIRARRGLFNGGQMPFGYKSDPDQKGYLVPDLDASPPVSEIFRKYLELGTYARVAAWLNTGGYLRPEHVTSRRKIRQASKWTINHIKNLLSNEAYIGVRVIGRRLAATHRPAPGMSKTKAAWPAIVDESLFTAVQAAIKKNARAGYCPTEKRQHTYLLSGVLKCDHCDMALVGDFGVSASGDRHFYYAHPRGLAKPNCPLPKRLKADRVDALALERMDLLASDKEILEKTIRATQAQEAESVPAIEERLASRRKELDRVNAEASAVLGSLATFKDGKGAEFIQPKLDELSDRRKGLEADIATQEAALERAKATGFNPAEIQLLLRNVRAVMSELPPYQQKELVRLMVRGATITPEAFTMDMLGGQQWVARLNASLALVGKPGRPKKNGPSDLFGWPVLWLTKWDECTTILRAVSHCPHWPLAMRGKHGQC